MIQLSSPNVGYFEQDVFDAFAFSQIAKAGPLTFFSGVAPLKGDLAQLTLVGNSQAEQVQFVLEVIEKLLIHEGLSKTDIATWTIYTTDIQDFATNSAQLLAEWLGDHRPTSSTIEVSGLIHPEQKIEITVTTASF